MMKTILLIVYRSWGRNSREVMEQLQKSLAERVPQMVGVGYLRFEHPGFKEAIEELAGKEFEKWWFQPFLETMLY